MCQFFMFIFAHQITIKVEILDINLQISYGKIPLDLVYSL